MATANQSSEDFYNMLRISVDLAEAIINDKIASMQAILSKELEKQTTT